MRKDIIWLLGALFVVILCLVNSYLESTLFMQVIWYIGAAVAFIAAGFNGYEVATTWRSRRSKPQSKAAQVSPPGPASDPPVA